MSAHRVTNVTWEDRMKALVRASVEQRGSHVKTRYHRERRGVVRKTEGIGITATIDITIIAASTTGMAESRRGTPRFSSRNSRSRRARCRKRTYLPSRGCLRIT